MFSDQNLIKEDKCRLDYDTSLLSLNGADIVRFLEQPRERVVVSRS